LTLLEGISPSTPKEFYPKIYLHLKRQRTKKNPYQIAQQVSDCGPMTGGGVSTNAVATSPDIRGFLHEGVFDHASSTTVASNCIRPRAVEKFACNIGEAGKRKTCKTQICDFNMCIQKSLRISLTMKGIIFSSFACFSCCNAR